MKTEEEIDDEFVGIALMEVVQSNNEFASRYDLLLHQNEKKEISKNNYLDSVANLATLEMVAFLTNMAYLAGRNYKERNN